MSTLRDPKIYLNKIELQKVPELSKYTVFGYIREHQELYNNDLFNIIPQLVIFIILAFYTDNIDEFHENLVGPNVKLSDDNKTITHFQSNYVANTTYGKKVIPSIDNEYKMFIKYIGIFFRSAQCI